MYREFGKNADRNKCVYGRVYMRSKTGQQRYVCDGRRSEHVRVPADTKNRWLSGFFWIRALHVRTTVATYVARGAKSKARAAAKPPRSSREPIHVRTLLASSPRATLPCHRPTCSPSAPTRPVGHHRSIPPSPKLSERLPS